MENVEIGRLGRVVFENARVTILNEITTDLYSISHYCG
jgi:hypothetical protein